MIEILFVCHGNICRSPMAQSVFASLLSRENLNGKVGVDSAAAHTDEIGNPPHRGTVEKLKAERIALIPHRARLLTRRDGEKYDFIIGMDEANVRDIRRIVGDGARAKVCKLLDFTARPRAIADPWYTGDFDATFSDVAEGCRALLAYLKENCL